MKKVFLWIGCFALISIGLYMSMSVKNNTPEDLIKKGEIIFIYEDAHIKKDIAEDDLKFLNEVFGGNKLYKLNMSCGFSHDVSIKVNDEFYFCIARDGCPTIFWQEKGKYFNIREENLKDFHCLLEKYGMKFPCI